MRFPALNAAGDAQEGAAEPREDAGSEKAEKGPGADVRVAAAGALALLDHGLVDEARAVLRLVLGR